MLDLLLHHNIPVVTRSWKEPTAKTLKLGNIKLTHKIASRQYLDESNRGHSGDAEKPSRYQRFTENDFQGVGTPTQKDWE